MKKSNVFGAVLCSAALACSMALPAFAVNATQDNATVTGSNTFTTTDKTQSTMVKGLAYGSDYIEDYISATVPATLTVVLPNPEDDAVKTDRGGAFKYVPSANSYKIVNSSSKGINVTKIAGTSENANWTLKAADASDLKSPATNGYNVSVKINGNDVASTTAITPIAIAKDESLPLSISGSAYWNNSNGGGAALLGDQSFNMVSIAYTVALQPTE